MKATLRSLAGSEVAFSFFLSVYPLKQKKGQTVATHCRVYDLLGPFCLLCVCIFYPLIDGNGEDVLLKRAKRVGSFSYPNYRLRFDLHV
ncbi:hypothetical protein DSCO28_26830 [Desulfosarcina ovata subsp. sediminis]|uniref:Uncharacterized protein n=1 Tax=Desulfosarcina ovata subsp. sediminis TaxID=885957 RepID=A0A5K7ZNY1_9BACT|nr:hypothetical protein DSCO28_26830 [Desulfosarcina ovata subsp. sediminis]